jgi:hypothetical protein
MMPEPPGCGLYRSARGRRTRSTVRKYPPEWRPLTSEIGGVYCRRFWQVKGVAIYADESVPFVCGVLRNARGTRMIRIPGRVCSAKASGNHRNRDDYRVVRIRG